MPQFDIIGLGAAFVDVAIRLKRMPRWDDPGRVTDFTLADGGAAATACAVASMVGLKTGFVDTFGNDDMADRKRASLEAAGVDLSHVVHRDAPEDHVTIVYVNEDTGERHFSFLEKLFIQDNGDLLYKGFELFMKEVKALDIHTDLSENDLFIEIQSNP